MSFILVDVPITALLDENISIVKGEKYKLEFTMDGMHYVKIMLGKDLKDFKFTEGEYDNMRFDFVDKKPVYEPDVIVDYIPTEGDCLVTSGDFCTDVDGWATPQQAHHPIYNPSGRAILSITNVIVEEIEQVKKIKEVPYYRDLEFKHKRRRF